MIKTNKQTNKKHIGSTTACLCNFSFCTFFFNVSACEPLGVANRNILPDARMSASAVYSSSYQPYYGRLNEDRGAKRWCPKVTDRTDYLQVDMGAVRYVCAVTTRGQRESSEWTTSYKLHLSSDGVTWNVYKENNVEKVIN